MGYHPVMRFSAGVGLEVPICRLSEAWWSRPLTSCS